MATTPLSRRRFLAGASSVALGAGLIDPLLAQPAQIAQDGQAPAPIPVSGLEVPGLASFDRLMLGMLDKWKIPGGSLAVMGRGQLLFARGYGWADAEKKKPVQPSSLFRIASISKTFTAVAVMKLVEQGKLDLDESAFVILDVEPLPGDKMDPRLKSITIRHLLEHAGGWDPAAPGAVDPGNNLQRVAQAVGKPSPASPQDMVRFMIGQPLQFDPGTRHAYSNFGYDVLGRIIEKVSGLSYEEFVRREVLVPAGVRRMKIGASRPEEREADEVSYFDRPGSGLVPSLFEEGKRVARPDGGFFMGARDSSGGWIASAVDLLRFVRALDPQTPPQVLGQARALLTPDSVAQMTARPSPPLWEGSPAFYALGWRVRPMRDGANWWHGGAMPGTSSLVVRQGNGLCLAALFNMLPAGEFDADLQPGLAQATRATTDWPRHDLFASLP